MFVTDQDNVNPVIHTDTHTIHVYTSAGNRYRQQYRLLVHPISVDY